MCTGTLHNGPSGQISRQSPAHAYVMAPSAASYMYALCVIAANRSRHGPTLWQCECTPCTTCTTTCAQHSNNPYWHPCGARHTRCSLACRACSPADRFTRAGCSSTVRPGRDKATAWAASPSSLPCTSAPYEPDRRPAEALAHAASDDLGKHSCWGGAAGNTAVGTCTCTFSTCTFEGACLACRANGYMHNNWQGAAWLWLKNSCALLSTVCSHPPGCRQVCTLISLISGTTGSFTRASREREGCTGLHE